MAGERLADAPMLDLIKYARSRVDERKQVGRHDREQYLSAAEDEIIKRCAENRENYRRDDGSKAAEHKSAVQKLL